MNSFPAMKTAIFALVNVTAWSIAQVIFMFMYEDVFRNCLVEICK